MEGGCVWVGVAGGGLLTFFGAYHLAADACMSAVISGGLCNLLKCYLYSMHIRF